MIRRIVISAAAVVLLINVALSATLTDTITCPEARCLGVTGWLFKYTLQHSNGTTGYTQVLVRSTDPIAHQTVACTTDKPCKNAKWNDVPATSNNPAPNAKYEALLEPIKSNGKTLMRQVRGRLLDPGTVRTLIDPGTQSVPVFAKSLTDAQTYAQTVIDAKEKAWVATTP